MNYMGTITEYGCIAEHLGHSFSGEIHHLLGLALSHDGKDEPCYRYTLQELRPDELADFLKQKSFRGINVTIPYKQAVMPYLDELTDIAREIGAVNTIINRDGRLIGDNTDFYGMSYLIASSGVDLQNKKVLIFGTGGTSKTAHAVAKHMGAREILKVSRQRKEGCLTYDKLFLHTDAEIIINTTPVGMFPRDEACPLPADLSLSDFKGLCGVFDAVYHPLRTELVLAAKALKIPATGGLAMLVAQAAAATERFLGYSVSDDIIRQITRTLNAQKQNIVLIGMPACGKTTVGQLLSQTLGRELIDTDEEITRAVGMTPGDYITKYGEAAFRKVEAEVIRDKIAPMSGVIVATGGGAVLDAQNVKRLKRNGVLCFLDRPLNSLQATKDRPLSADPKLLRRRYEERYDIYCSAADVRLPIDENETPDATARRILTMAQEV